MVFCATAAGASTERRTMREPSDLRFMSAIIKTTEARGKEQTLRIGEAITMTCELFQKSRRDRIELADAPQFIIELITDLVYHSARQRLLGSQHAIGEKELLRRGRRHRFSPSRRPAESGDDAKLRAGMRETRAGRGEAQIE